MRTLLVVDDKEESRYMLDTLLRSAGYTLLMAANGIEALEIAKNNQSDMVITDILMPEMDGFTLCRRWKADERFKNIPFVFYSAAYTEPQDIEFALSLGAERFIVKPTEPEEFVEKLREVFEEHKAGRLVAPRSPVAEEEVYLREYNKALIRRLEEKVEQLEKRTNEYAAVLQERTTAEQALQARVRQQAAVAQLGQKALAGADPGSLMNEAVTLLAQTLEVDYAKVLELLPEQDALLLRAGVGWKEGLVGHATVSSGAQSQAGYTLHSDQPVIVEDLRTETRFRGPALLEEHGVVSGMSIVIQGPHKPFGVLGVHVVKRRVFTQDDIHFLQSVANVIGEAIERTRAEQEIKDLNKDLERRVIERTRKLQMANRELDAFTHSVSHDLHAPLRAINGFTKAIMEDYGPLLDERGKDYLQRVQGASHRMTELVDDLLDLSRATRSPVRRERIPVSDLAKMIAGELKRTQPERLVQFVIKPGMVAQGDTRLLRIALENLMGNAWKYTQKTQSARIEFGQIDYKKKPAYFVRDDGVGFDMAHAGKLFNAFQRLHTNAEFPGSGLGLTIVHRIIVRHGGHIWAESALGKGATFYFTLA